jgi:predicted metal-dependent phosphotriesterase family hydrolase
MTLLKHKRELVKRARKIAARGGFVGFDDVSRQFESADAETLKLWATDRDRAEVDRICSDAKLRQRLS